ncbi:MAG: 2-phospho-L-lactate guanylyltransferase [Euzebya sp.]
MSTDVTVTAVIPLKAVGASKTRLSSVLSPADRALLLHRTFERVAQAVAAATSVRDCVVVVGDAQGRSWAQDLGLSVQTEPADSRGLNAALRAVDQRLGARPTLVVPADLPLVTGSDLDAAVAALPAPRAVVVARTSDGGTGALVRVPGGVIRPCFGPQSAQAHIDQAALHGVSCASVWIPGLALDLDQPADLELAGGWSAITTGRTLNT